MIFFNVKEVRKYLIEKGFVYTLRKPRVRIGKDIAVFGNYYKHETIGREKPKEEVI